MYFSRYVFRPCQWRPAVREWLSWNRGSLLRVENKAGFRRKKTGNQEVRDKKGWTWEQTLSVGMSKGRFALSEWKGRGRDAVGVGKRRVPRRVPDCQGGASRCENLSSDLGLTPMSNKCPLWWWRGWAGGQSPGDPTTRPWCLFWL